jgi:hypothetical protein
MAMESIPGVLDGVTLEGKHFRMIAQALAGGDVASFAGGVSAANGGAHGVTTSGGMDVTESGTPAMSVDVAPGAALITGTLNIEQGVYVTRNNTSTTLTIAAADATNDRHDLVIAQARDAIYSGVDSDARLTVVTGTASAPPVDPSLASYPNALVLARVVVPNGATAITNADIVDLRTFAGRQELVNRLPYTPWTAYTPTLQGAGWALGSTGAAGFGAYTVMGGTCFFHARLIFGTVGATFSANIPEVSLPIPSTEPAGGLPLRSSVVCEIRDTSSGLCYPAPGDLAGGTSALLMCQVSSGAHSYLGYVVQGTPFTFAASDEIRMSGWYRV